MLSEKEEAKKLIESLPSDVSWDDIMYEFYVNKKLDDSLRAAAEGRVLTHQQVKERLRRE